MGKNEEIRARNGVEEEVKGEAIFSLGKTDKG